jgi:DNA-binding PadR family transcriptional regulator
VSARGLTRLEHVVLGVLTNQPRHAYALKQRLAPGLPRENQINDGVLYPLLARLERRGLVTSTTEGGDRGRARRVYAVTAEGEAAFHAWLRSDEDEGGDLSYDLFIGQPLVKLLFAADLTPAQRRAKLASLTAAAQTRLRALQAIEAAPPPDGFSDIGRAMLDIGIAQQRAAIATLQSLDAGGAAELQH